MLRQALLARGPEHEPGVGYIWGEGIREPLRIRAGWVPDEVIKQLESFITTPLTRETALLPVPTVDQGGMAA